MNNGFWVTLIPLACFFRADLTYWASTNAQPDLAALTGPPDGLADEVTWVTMAQLADFPVEDVAHSPELLEARIPDAIKALNGKQIVVDGFMYPLDSKEGKVTELILFRHFETCCFGGSPLPHDFIAVTMVDGNTAWAGYSFELVRTEGRLEVGVKTDELGNLESIYRLEGVKSTVVE